MGQNQRIQQKVLLSIFDHGFISIRYFPHYTLQLRNIYYFYRLIHANYVFPHLWKNENNSSNKNLHYYLKILFCRMLIILLQLSNQSSHQRCSVKKGVSQNSQENTCAWVSFLIKLQAIGLFTPKITCQDSKTGVFLWKRTAFFIEHLWWLLLNIEFSSTVPLYLKWTFKSKNIRQMLPHLNSSSSCLFRRSSENEISAFILTCFCNIVWWEFASHFLFSGIAFSFWS